MLSRKYIQAPAVLLLAFSLGLHSLVLQTVAWASMTLDFARNAPIAQAIQQTFDERNACSLCRAITQGQQAEDDQESDGVMVKIEAVMRQQFVRPKMPPAIELSLCSSSNSSFGRGDPPSPPPQVHV